VSERRSLVVDTRHKETVMERAMLDAVRFEVDGGYLPGGDQTAELGDSLPDADHDLEVGTDPTVVGDRLDASLFAAMLHP
jgi:hypothetical protein